MRNIEAKFELRDPGLARTALHAANAWHVATLTQSDTYFRVPAGRLKRREAAEITHPATNRGTSNPDRTPQPLEYIHYARTNKPTPRISDFTILDSDTFKARYGSQPLPILAAVTKTRDLFMTGTANAVRVHLDDVESLGHFIEFEALVTRQTTVPKAHEELARIRALLAPALGEPVSHSYADLVAPHLRTDDTPTIGNQPTSR